MTHTLPRDKDAAIYDKNLRWIKDWEFEDSIFYPFTDADINDVVNRDWELSKMKGFIKSDSDK